MKRLKAFLLCALLVSCASKEIYTAQSTQQITVPLSNGNCIEVTLPSGNLVLTDNFTFWKFDNETIVRTFSSQIPEQSLKKENNNFVTENIPYQDGTISITCLNGYERSIEIGDIISNDIQLSNSRKLPSLPYSDKEVNMYLDEHNLYMPVNPEALTNQGYISSICMDGVDWIESWVYDGNYENIKTLLMSIAFSNTTTDDYYTWYEDDDIFYLCYGNHIVATKKMTLKQYYVYTGTLKYEDYILQGLNKVHRRES